MLSSWLPPCFTKLTCDLNEHRSSVDKQVNRGKFRSVSSEGYVFLCLYNPENLFGSLRRLVNLLRLPLRTLVAEWYHKVEPFSRVEPVPNLVPLIGGGAQE